jgi:hypothetical protein
MSFDAVKREDALPKVQLVAYSTTRDAPDDRTKGRLVEMRVSCKSLLTSFLRSVLSQRLDMRGKKEAQIEKQSLHLELHLRVHSNSIRYQRYIIGLYRTRNINGLSV